MHSARTLGNKTITMNLMLGVFLKLLGFFVIMYSYAEINPIKAEKAEESLKQRFNVSVSLYSAVKESIDGTLTEGANVNGGGAYAHIQQQLMREFGLPPGKYIAQDDILVMRIPAGNVLSIDNITPENPGFANNFSRLLLEQNTDKFRYAVEIIVLGNNGNALMRSISEFANEMSVAGYPDRLLTIGLKAQENTPQLEIRIKQVPA